MVDSFNTNHINPYKVFHIDMNYTLFDREEDHLDPFKKVDEAKLRVYVIHEQKVIMPNLIQEMTEQQG